MVVDRQHSTHAASENIYGPTQPYTGSRDAPTRPDPLSRSSRTPVDFTPRESSSMDNGDGSAGSSHRTAASSAHTTTGMARPERVSSTNLAYIDENIYGRHITSQHTQTGFRYFQTAVTTHDKSTETKMNVQNRPTTRDNGNDPMWYQRMWKVPTGRVLHTNRNCNMGGRSQSAYEVERSSQLRAELRWCKTAECRQLHEMTWRGDTIV